jgi:transcriptional regulator with XRE-family HTH domain
MDAKRLGRAFRAVRVRKRLRQDDVGAAAGVSGSTVSRIEAGSLDEVSLRSLLAVAGALGMTVSITAAWEGAELDRLLGGRHSAMHEVVAVLMAGLDGWVSAPEVSFSIYGERGVIDILCWHAATRTLLVIELKTELADVQATVGTLDRKVRLASRIAADRGWQPLVVACWLLIAEGATNRRRVGAHRTMLRNAFPVDGRSMAAWLRAPSGAVRAMSFLSDSRLVGATARLAPVKRVRRPRPDASGARVSGGAGGGDA